MTYVLIRTRSNRCSMDKKTPRSANSCAWATSEEFDCVRIISWGSQFQYFSLLCFAFKFDSNRLMSSANITRYSIHSWSWTYALMDFSPDQAVKFCFALNMVRWPTWKNSFEFISSRTWSQSFVGSKTLFFWNGCIHRSCCLWALPWNEFTITARWKHRWISSNRTHIMSCVELRPICSTPRFSN